MPFITWRPCSGASVATAAARPPRADFNLQAAARRAAASARLPGSARPARPARPACPARSRSVSCIAFQHSRLGSHGLQAASGASGASGYTKPRVFRVSWIKSTACAGSVHFPLLFRSTNKNDKYEVYHLFGSSIIASGQCTGQVH